MDTLNDIVRLLKEAKTLGGDALEFSDLMMQEFRNEMTGIACWSATSKPARFFRRRTPEVVRAEKDAMLQKSRRELRRKLTLLLEWARQKQASV